ncbi:hypothetical protein LINPERPRIM_LOCUS16567 [Linum perenne]
MAYLKTLQPPLQAFSSTTKQHSSSSSSSIATMKSIKTLIHTLVVAHLCRAFRALRRAKSILIQALKDHNFPFHYLIIYPSSSSSSTHRSKRIHVSNKHKKIFFGSFRLHYNWGSTSSSHVLPVPDSVLRGFDEYEGSCSWKKNSGAEVEGGGGGATLAGYLLWLEEKDKERKKISDEDVANEIDRLAEMFIADCHEKFQLEKQESMRRFQEMMARSM